VVGVRHNCGIAFAHTINEVYAMGKGIQHRGREAAGLFAMRADPPYTIDCIKWLGPLSRFNIGALKAMLPYDNYKFFGLHTRYATRGRKDRLLAEAHPHVIGGKVFTYSDYEIIHEAEKVMIHNGQVDFSQIDSPLVDKDLTEFECDTLALLHFYDRHGLTKLIETIPGAFTIIIADAKKNKVFAGRDTLAMKPGVIGERNGNIYIASEQTALDEVKAFTKETLSPGKVYEFKNPGSYLKKKICKAQQKTNVFF
jgi:glutamine phosphoribosylpyrophosphate amidotransferase